MHSTFMERVALDKGNCSIVSSSHLDSAEAKFHLNICICRARMGELVEEAPSAALAGILSFHCSCWIFVTYLPSMASVQSSCTYSALMQQPGLSDLLRSRMGSIPSEGVSQQWGLRPWLWFHKGWIHSSFSCFLPQQTIMNYLMIHGRNEI